MPACWERFKPAASVRTHLLAAAVLWTVVGTGLLSIGGYWARPGDSASITWLLALAALGGLLKGHFVLRRAAERIVRRIETRGDGRCLGGFISLRTWLLVGLMMGSGYWLRHGLLPRPVVGLVYVAVGSALLWGSSRLWRAWCQTDAAARQQPPNGLA